MAGIEDILKHRELDGMSWSDRPYLDFPTFLGKVREAPYTYLRDVFQLVHDMVHFYVPPGVDEFPEDEESVHFVRYDFDRLLIRGSDSPYFADRLFGNRFMDLIDSFSRVPDWHKIYLVEGPPGSGKSTFLKNFLYRFQRYIDKEPDGEYYETCWILDNEILDGSHPAGESSDLSEDKGSRELVVPCPHHDNPILQIPKDLRDDMLREVINDDEAFNAFRTEKRFKWVFKAEPCPVCLSMFEALLDRLHSPLKVLERVHPRRFKVNRRLGEGISVYNPGDAYKKKVNANPMLQKRLDELFGDSNKVRYQFSDLARTNNGIHVIMDVKDQNRERIQSLHGVVSDGIHRVESVEETIKTLFIALINPQDKEHIEKTKSLKDRTVYIKMPYVLDYATEVRIYKNNFGERIEADFLPHVLENFAKVIIASRLGSRSEGLEEWILDPNKYAEFCDQRLKLLKMDLYTGRIPDWVDEEDRRSFKARIRRSILSDSEDEGFEGITGRESIYMFNEFYSIYSKRSQLINMRMLRDFFAKRKEESDLPVDDDFLESLVRSYDYEVLQQIKECLYTYNRNMIADNLSDYIFAVNFDPDSREINPANGHLIEISDSFYETFETVILGMESSKREREEFRNDVLHRYVSETATELSVDHKKLHATTLYRDLHTKYLHSLKQHVLDPFLGNDQFRNAIKEYGSREFKSYDKKTKKDVSFLLRKLQRNYGYTDPGAREVCLYIMDKHVRPEESD